MNHFVSILCTALLLPLFTTAQDFIKIKESTYSGFTGSEQSVFEVTIDRVEKSVIEKHWKDYLSELTESEVEIKNHQIVATGVVVKKIQERPLTVFMHFYDQENGTRVHVGFQDSINGFISPSDIKHGITLRNIIHTETQKVYLDAKRNDIEKEEDYLKDLEKDLKKAEKEHQKVEKNILKDQRKIARLQQDIEIQKTLLESLRTTVANKHKALNTLPPTATKDQRKFAKKELKKAEKDLDKASDAIDKDTEEIFDLEGGIRDYNYELDKIKQDISLIKNKVLEQRNIILLLKDHVYDVDGEKK